MKNILITSALLLFCAVSIAQVSTLEKQALVDLYVATQGENWNNTWDLNTPVENWHGVTVTDNKVTVISLLFNNLEGEIPQSFGKLIHLEKIELSFNNISGEIPRELANLKNLRLIAFNGNNLTGNIPEFLGTLKSLEALHLSSNNFEGELPKSLGDLSKLEVLNVFDNNLEGIIPAELMLNSNLKQLIIAENNIERTEKYTGILMFKNEEGYSKFKRPSVTTQARTVIAIETNDDEN